jgi:diacylglycerol O-acyltransferase
MDPLGLLDAEFVEVEDEDRHVSMAIASIAVFDGPDPSYDEFVTAIGERLPVVPRYRQKLRTVPFGLGVPVWVDDPAFDLRYHIRPIALPEPGGDAELARLMALVMAQRLDRDRPLWEDWLVTGLAGDHWAVISKVHHCMVDGVSGTDLYRVMFDVPPLDAVPPVAQMSPEPSAIELMSRATLDLLLLPARNSRAALRLLHPPQVHSPHHIDHRPGHVDALPEHPTCIPLVSERPDRPAAPLHLGTGAVRGHPDHKGRARRHHQ